MKVGPPPNTAFTLRPRRVTIFGLHARLSAVRLTHAKITATAVDNEIRFDRERLVSCH
jgi:hypothetical protein